MVSEQSGVRTWWRGWTLCAWLIIVWVAGDGLAAPYNGQVYGPEEEVGDSDTTEAAGEAVEEAMDQVERGSESSGGGGGAPGEASGKGASLSTLVDGIDDAVDGDGGGESSGVEPEGGPEIPTEEAAVGFSPREIYEAAAEGVVIIRTEQGVGAGFLVGDTRTVATAFHVIEAGGPIAVLARNGKHYVAEVYAYDRPHDLALLKLDRPFEGAGPLPLAPTGATAIGDPVVAIGHPFGAYSEEKPFKGLLTWTVTSGVVGALSPDSIQTDAAINPGNSGGPLLDRRGRIVGVVTSKLRDAQSVGFAVPVAHLERLLAQEGPSPPLQPARKRNVGIGFGNLQTEQGLRMDGFSFSFIQVARNRGSRVGVALGYNSVDEVPESGEFLGFTENMYWLQAEWGPRFHLPPIGHVMDVVVAGRVAWWEREKLRVSASTVDPECDLATTACDLTFQFDPQRRAGLRIYALGALVFPLSPIEIGIGALLDPVEDPTARWTVWVAVLL